MGGWRGDGGWSDGWVRCGRRGGRRDGFINKLVMFNKLVMYNKTVGQEGVHK